MTNLYPVRRALISVSDKTGLIDLAKALSAGGIEIYRLVEVRRPFAMRELTCAMLRMLRGFQK